MSVLSLITNWCDGSTYNVLVLSVGGACATTTQVLQSFAATAWGGQYCWGPTANQFWCSAKSGCPSSSDFTSMGLCGFENITVPDSGTANTQGTLQASVVGVSIEFFAFPRYFNASMVPTTQKCLQNLKDAANGNPTNIRIGGTTQDRAQYDPNLTVPVNYTVSSATAAPMSLTYGPLFIELAASISGKVTLGLNRELANLKNTISAAKYAVSTVPNLVGIELGNEPEFYGSSAAIANGSSWTTAADAASQISWQASLCTAINKTDIIQAGVFLQPENGWSIANLAPKEVSGGSLDYVSSFGEHGYPQSACSGATTNLTTLMLHSDIVSYTKRYIAESAAARAVSKDFYISETNSATCGGGGISPTFGAALWVLDYAMQSIINGAVRLYFHHGTLGNSPYSWWGESYTYAPFYGAYFATLALADMTSIQAIDGGTTAYASYGLYKDSVLSKILLYNSDLYSSGNRSFHTFNVQFNASTVDRTFKALRLSAPSATSLVESGVFPNISGLTFSNSDCSKVGSSTPEIYTVTANKTSVLFTVQESEALLIYV